VVTLEDAVFRAAMETAGSLLTDGRPLLSERVMVWGLGGIGLHTTKESIRLILV
jgi:hypothetical protein